MAPSLLPPPAAPPSPAPPPPRLPLRVPLLRERPPRSHPGRSPGALVLSLSLHGAALILLVAGVRIGPRIVPGGVGESSEIVYLDLQDFPSTVPDGIPGAVSAPGGAASAPGFTTPSAPQTVPAPAPAASAPSVPRRMPPTGGPRQESGTRGAAPSAGPSRVGVTGRGAGASTGSAGAGGTSAAGRLGGGWRDPRLIPTPRELSPERELTEHERYMAQLEARLGVWNDSVAGDAERARRATDWTRTDKSGKKWGVSPGKIHLGGITLPAPSGFSPPPAQEEEGKRRARQRAEIDRQVDDAERRQAWEEQKRSARERADRERAEREGDGS